MKVLFVGEGNQDIGPGEFGEAPRPAAGVVPILSRKVFGSIDPDSLAIAWREIPRLNRAGGKKGFEAKVAAAALLSARRFGCAGTICVADQDRDPDRLVDMGKGKERARRVVGEDHRIACGLAVESIEAWTLGERAALAAELGIEAEEVRRRCPLDVESLYERSGKPEHRPKGILENIAQIKNRQDSTEFRQLVAERTDTATLEKVCPQGFKPFADELRSAFGSAT